jgi:tetratricopeptide (TPR) repeat protein
MEFLEGATLNGWRTAARRRWQDVLDVCLAAGRGLAAAHDVGLVHRDFKPDNVMLDADGRVVVLDFGLARRLDVDLQKRLTMPGQMMGTPAYMAPEQHRGGEVGPAADQFAFCVALWEALHRERPYPGETLLALVFAIENGSLRTPKPGTAPAWLTRLLTRGLARQPEERFASMRQLLDEVRRGDPRRRRRPVVFGLGLALVAASGIFALAATDRARRSECEREAGEVRERWDRSQREGIASAFVATELPFAGESFDLVVPWIERQIAAEAELSLQTCLARLDATVDPTVADARMQCLAERRAELEELVRQLLAADAALVTDSVHVAARLLPAEGCRDRRIARDPTADETRAELLRDISSTRVLVDVDAALAQARARTAITRSIELGDPLVEAQARLVLGQALDSAGNYELARAELESALAIGLRLARDEIVVDAASRLVFLVGYRIAEFETALVFARVAESGLRTLGAGEDDLRWAELLHTRAIVSAQLGRTGEARSDQERALAIRERVLGPDHPFVAASLNSLAATLHRSGALADARDMQTRALEVTRRGFGSEHVRTVAYLINLAQIEDSLGDSAAAHDHLEAALRISTKHRGPDHPEVGTILLALGANRYAVHERASALELFERALANGERNLGPDHPRLANMLDNVGALEHELGNLERARELHERSLSIRENKLPGQPILARSLDNLGRVVFDAGDPERALELHTRAVELLDADDPADQVEYAAALIGSGRALVATANAKEGIVRIERGITIWAARPDTKDGYDLAMARLSLAEALWTDRARQHEARASAERAKAYFATRAGHDRELARIDAWLETHAG